jgi:MFS transporter, NNP family, nitrate/nitrite transporter
MSRDERQRAEPVESSLWESLPPILLLTTIFLLNFLSRIILGPMMPVIEEDLHLTHGQAGSLFLLISMGYCLVISTSGFVSSRFTHRNTICLSAVCIGCALLFVALSQRLWSIRVGLVVLGMGAGLYLPSAMAVITRMVRSQDWGKAIAVHELAPNLGFVVAPLLAQIVLGWTSWRGLLVLLGASSLFSGIVFFRFGDAGAFPGTAPSGEAIRALTRELDFWLMMVLFSLGVGASLGIYTMLPLYLVAERGMELNQANTVVALSRVSALGMAFVGGWAVDRLGARLAMGIVFLLSGSLTVLLGMVSGSWLLILVFLQPLFSVCFFPPAFAALSRIGPPGVRNVTVSLTVPVAFLLGGGAIPAAIGWLGEVGAFSLAIVGVGGVTLASVVLTRRLRLGE